MAFRLIDRNRQIPNGMLFYQPQTKWRSTPWASFTSIVDSLISHRQANTWLNLPTDRPTVEAEVDAFNANVCHQMGWNDYISASDGGSPPPLPPRPPSLSSSLTNVAAGAEINIEFIRSKEEAVAPALSTQRALVCVDCPQNGKGDLTRWFTLPVSAAIRKTFQILRGWDLKTPHDNALGVCQACNCPLKLKVHYPMKLIREKMPDSAKAALDPRCWILNEP